MDKYAFKDHYPFREKDSNKYDNGVVAFLSGSYGMAGAALFNLIGAKSAGASYIHSYLPASIYQIVAVNEMSAVYHPYDDSRKDIFDEASFRKAGAVCAGSGIDRLKYKKEYLEEMLKTVSVPFIIDAGGLRLLGEDRSLYSLNDKLILTPHLGEFSALTQLSIEEVLADRERIAVSFARNKNVILILKGPQTLVVSPKGEVYMNMTGNPALAQAGSGDVLSGIICALCALYDDTYQACIDAVWLHGYLADLAINKHAAETFDLREYPVIADSFFFGLKCDL